MYRLSNCNAKHSNDLYTGLDSRIFVQQLFFSCFLDDFDAQYGKLGVYGVKEFIFGLKCRDNLKNNVIFVIIVF